MEHKIKMSEAKLTAGIPFQITQLSSKITMDAMKLLVDKLMPKSSLKNAKSPITELNQTFEKKVEAINQKLALNKHTVVHTFADNQVAEKR